MRFGAAESVCGSTISSFADLVSGCGDGGHAIVTLTLQSFDAN